MLHILLRACWYQSAIVLKEVDLDKQFVWTDLMNYITSCTECIVGLVISESGLEFNS